MDYWVTFFKNTRFWFSKFGWNVIKPDMILTPRDVITLYSGIRDAVPRTKFKGREYLYGIAQLYVSIDDGVHPCLMFADSVDRFVNQKIGAKKLLLELDDLLLIAIKNFQTYEWDDIMTSLDQTQRFRVFAHFASEMTDKDYWKYLGMCYRGSDLAHLPKDIIEKYLFSERSEREFIMSEKDVIAFENLPSEVTIYRGCSLEEIDSGNYRYSWSLDKSVAEFFAKKYIRNRNVKGGVIELTVPKSKLWAYFNDRNEQEIIYRHN
jgi:hypothetical protein